MISFLVDWWHHTVGDSHGWAATGLRSDGTDAKGGLASPARLRLATPTLQNWTTVTASPTTECGGASYDTWAPRDSGCKARRFHGSLPQPMAEGREGPSKGGPSRSRGRTTAGAPEHWRQGGLGRAHQELPLPRAGGREGPSGRGPSRTASGPSGVAATHARQSSPSEAGCEVPLPSAGGREGPSQRGPSRASRQPTKAAHTDGPSGTKWPKVTPA